LHREQLRLAAKKFQAKPQSREEEYRCDSCRTFQERLRRQAWGLI
jgi:hypothetical protein